MIKPKYGFANENNKSIIQLPKGWESEEKQMILRKRRIYYDVKLYDWIIRNDIDGDKMIIKTIKKRGVGYDRPFDYDEINLDIKIYQDNNGKEVVY